MILFVIDLKRAALRRLLNLKYSFIFAEPMLQWFHRWRVRD
jgi:hypothetical protein